jgi:CheY-like chemotaxis protein
MALVLVIDDASTVREVLRRMLTSADHAVIEAADGEAGLLLFEERSPELVITDLIMPKKEGIETIQQIRRSRPDAKIVAISGSTAAGGKLYLGAAKKLGADAVLAKPFQPAELLEIVTRLLAPA